MQDKKPYRFRFESTEGSQHVVVETNVINLGDLLETFEDFLKASGFSVKGHLEFTDEDELDADRESNEESEDTLKSKFNIVELSEEHVEALKKSTGTDTLAEAIVALGRVLDEN